MDPLVARRLDTDEEFKKKVVKIATDYLKLGFEAVDYWSADFDVAYDLMMCYAPLSKDDFEKLARNSPKRFVLPTTATQITTMATYIAQSLFGNDTPHKVEGRGPDDEIPAEYINQLLRWNDEQQPTYMLGYLWVQDCLVANRGVFYNHWQPIFRPKVTMEERTDSANMDFTTGQPKVGPDGQPLKAKFNRPKRTNELVGGYVKTHLVSPYDFICDPALPLWRLQEGRFCGHKTMIPFTELEKRSKLDPSDPAYVLPKALQAIRDKKQTGVSDPTIGIGGGSTGPGTTTSKISRSAYERTRSASPTGADKANKDDVGVPECHELWVRLDPELLYSDDSQDPGTPLGDPIIVQFLIANQTSVLCLNESTYEHGQYPYSVGEARPSGQFQFSPSWAIILKGIQDYCDWLKNKHQDALSRTVGNVFIVNPSKVDVEDFLNPDKEGLVITLNESAAGERIGDVIQQVPIKDLTENFHQEMMGFIKLSESASAATSQMQGNTSNADSATQYAGDQQMSAGRLASIARLLSVQAVIPQTKQTVSLFQQFLSKPQSVRFIPRGLDMPQELFGVKSVAIERDTIQGEFDYIVHDGTLPGTDARKVAALERVAQAAAVFPQVFSPAPGNLDPRRIIFEAAKAAGIRTDGLLYRPQDLAGAAPGAPGPIPAPAGPAGPPGPSPAGLAPLSLPPISLPSASPPQIRPSQG